MPIFRKPNNPAYPCSHARNRGCPIDRRDVPPPENLEAVREALNSQGALTQEQAAELLPPVWGALANPLYQLAPAEPDPLTMTLVNDVYTYEHISDNNAITK